MLQKQFTNVLKTFLNSLKISLSALWTIENALKPF
jgi:hypothetical protein